MKKSSQGEEVAMIQPKNSEFPVSMKQQHSSNVIDSSNSELIEILESWKQFNLEEKKISLDKNCVEMRELKTASIAGRKRLNDITKAYRSSTNTMSVTDLLKAYQEEIDQLSRRSKYSETAFFAIFKSLHDLPGTLFNRRHSLIVTYCI
jgi:homeobox protein cut-like